MFPRRKHSRSESKLEIRKLRGLLRWEGHEIQVQWTLRINHEGHISLVFSAIKLTKETAWMLDVASGNELFGSWAAVTGTTQDGITVTSEHVHLGSQNQRTGARGTFVKLAGESVRLQITRQTLPRRTSGLKLIYGTVGMEGFSVQRVESSIGRISLAGPSDVANYDTLVGMIEVLAPARPLGLSRWLVRADSMVDRVLDMVSLAEGRIIRWSVRHVVRGKVILSSEFHGPQRTGRPHDGAGHFLNLQPFLDLAVRRYTPALRDSTGFHVALQWFLSNPRYREQELLAAIVALEHLVATYASRHRTPKIVAQRTFALLKHELHSTFDEFSNAKSRRHNIALQRKLPRIRGKLGTLNEAPFRDKLMRLLNTYRVALVGIEASIPAAIAARNLVVHRGVYSDEPDASERLLEHVMVLRELLKRIFLKLLEYRGSYHTAFPHRGHEVFPPKEDGAA